MPAHLARVGEPVYVIDDTRTHQGCSLVNGEFEGTTLICACHSSEFDVTNGSVLHAPATAPVRLTRCNSKAVRSRVC